jgi:hypothetical protein
MKILQIGSIIVATTITAVFPIGKNLSAKPNAAVEAETNSETPSSIALSAERGDSSEYELTALPEEAANGDTPKTQQTKSEDYFSVRIIRLMQRRQRQTYRIYLLIHMPSFHVKESRQMLF